MVKTGNREGCSPELESGEGVVETDSLGDGEEELALEDSKTHKPVS
jgi:hypothetical protein